MKLFGHQLPKSKQESQAAYVDLANRVAISANATCGMTLSKMHLLVQVQRRFWFWLCCFYCLDTKPNRTIITAGLLLPVALVATEYMFAASHCIRERIRCKRKPEG